MKKKHTVLVTVTVVIDLDIARNSTLAEIECRLEDNGFQTHEPYTVSEDIPRHRKTFSQERSAEFVQCNFEID